MSDMPQNDGGSAVVRYMLMGAAVVYMIGSVIFMVQAQNRISDMEKQQIVAERDMAKKVDDATSQMRADLGIVADRVGLTQKDLNSKAGLLQSEEKATQTRLKSYVEATKEQFGEVTNEVNGVKGQVSRVSADINDTRTDLAATKGKLENAIGDINKHSELIATTHDQLEQLRHRGDRDYIEFTLHRGKEPTHLSTVSLQLKKVDPKKGEFTLYVMADDKRIEKKDRNINEPLQFYSGRERNLFEVVINAVDKDVVSGYMSTPKNVASNTRPDPRAQ
jgi:chromosome segregation ATPase